MSNALNEANETILALKARNRKLEQDCVTLLNLARQWAAIDMTSMVFVQIVMDAKQRASDVLDEMGGRAR